MPAVRQRILLAQLPIPPAGPEPIQGNVPLAAAYLALLARRRGLDQRYAIEILPAPWSTCWATRPWWPRSSGAIRGWSASPATSGTSNARSGSPSASSRPGPIWSSCSAARKSPPTTRGSFPIPRSTTPSSAKGSRPSPSCSPRWPKGRVRRIAPRLSIAGLWSRGDRAAPPRRAPLAAPRRDLLPLPRRHPRRGRGEAPVSGNRPRLRVSGASSATTPRATTDCTSSPARRSSPTSATHTERGAREVVLLDPTLNQRRDFAEFVSPAGRAQPGTASSPASASSAAKESPLRPPRLLRRGQFLPKSRSACNRSIPRASADGSAR